MEKLVESSHNYLRRSDNVFSTLSGYTHTGLKMNHPPIPSKTEVNMTLDYRGKERSQSPITWVQ